ncbi:hypothetical protein [Bradyrhizobium sp. URHD0069]|uniref:hypothetical protein n=1 Tax=Bradyrhizobium sp. URHD0069 TaxID=1380355 RepID=UPI0004961AB5|nr:hypothetical protein [Bradyrhizobium sp. URHD0069]
MAATGLKRALVVGCSANVWEEVQAASNLVNFDAYYCVKLAGVHWEGPRFTWCGLHPEWQEKYKAERAALGLHSKYETVGPLASECGMHGNHPVDRRVSYRWPGMNSSGSSGLFAVKVALEDGFDRVVLAGVPMTTEPHFTRGKPWAQRDSFTKGMTESIPHFAGRVRSMSGYTKEILGSPTPGWLAESRT